MHLCQLCALFVHTPWDIIFSLRERASDFDVYPRGRTEDVTACTPRKSLGP